MAQRYLDRYKRFRSDEDYKPVPGVKIPVKSTDKTIIYKLGTTRFDILSNDYYDCPYFGWLIMLANPQYGGLEFSIPNNAPIRVPFPFKPSIDDYLSGVEKYLKLYG